MIKKKILIVTECFYPEKFKINDLAINWAKNNYQIDILTLCPSYPEGIIKPGFKNHLIFSHNFNGVKVIRFKTVLNYNKSIFKKILKYLSFMIFTSFYVIIFGKKYDYVFGYNMSALTNMVSVALIRRIYKIPTIIWVQDLWPQSVYEYGIVKKNSVLGFFLDKFVYFIYNSFNKFAISSKSFEQHILAYSKKNPEIIFAPNWPDHYNFKEKDVSNSINKNKINFTFAGNIGKFQNLENIIIAFNMLDDKYINKCQLNIIGAGSNLNKLKKLNIKNKINFIGYINSSEIYSYLIASDYLIISLKDSDVFNKIIPSKLQTYLKAKKPIFGIINGETKDLIDKYKIGICAKPNDINDIMSKIIKLSNLNSLDRKNFIKYNDNLLKNEFNEEKIINKLLKFLTEN